MTQADRVVWRQEHVVDVRDAHFAARTYYEHADLRRILGCEVPSAPLARACEIGSGFGRVTCVLAEFSVETYGFEREPDFVNDALALYPGIQFRKVESLESLPVADLSMNMILTFTVLQHLVQRELLAVVREISRIMAPGGLLVLCEETDPTHVSGDTESGVGMCTIGRSVEEYERIFEPFRLLRVEPRRIEPTYERPDVGSYMVFRAAI